MATPTQLHASTRPTRIFTPWNASLAPQHSAPILSITAGPNGSACPGQMRPFHPAPGGGHVEPDAGDFTRFILKLDRDDGDQFLGDLNFKMPPGFTGSLRGISYCPEAAIARGRAEARPQPSSAHPSCPASSQIGTTNVAAGPGRTPVPRGRQDVPGRAVQGRAALGRRDHPGARRPL